MTTVHREQVHGFAVDLAGPVEADALLLIHGAITFQGCRPLLRQPALTDRWRLIHYYRRGYDQGPAAPPDVTIADHAADSRFILNSLQVSAAHVLGHSVGASVAMQLALDAPDRVRSLVLIEPMSTSRPELLAWFQAAIAPAVSAYAAGDHATAADHMLRLVDRDHYRETLDGVLGQGWFDASKEAIDAYFKIDLPAAASWTLDPTQAERLTQPALVLRGGATRQEIADVAADITAQLPHGLSEVVAGATHNVIASKPEITARLISEFLSNQRL